MGVVSRRWMWVESMGVASGCGCKEVYRFPYITYPYSSCICSFLQQHLYFLFIKKKMFFALVIPRLNISLELEAFARVTEEWLRDLVR